LVYEIGENVRRRLHVPPAKMREHPIFANKSLKAKSQNKFAIFFDISKEAFMYLQRKNQLSTFIQSVFFSQRYRNREILCVCAMLCAVVDHLSEQNRGLVMIFFKKFSL
jgi:hypothetical protein